MRNLFGLIVLSVVMSGCATFNLKPFECRDAIVSFEFDQSLTTGCPDPRHTAQRVNENYMRCVCPQ